MTGRRIGSDGRDARQGEPIGGWGQEGADGACWEGARRDGGAEIGGQRRGMRADSALYPPERVSYRLIGHAWYARDQINCNVQVFMFFHHRHSAH